MQYLVSAIPLAFSIEILFGCSLEVRIFAIPIKCSRKIFGLDKNWGWNSLLCKVFPHFPYIFFPRTLIFSVSVGDWDKLLKYIQNKRTGWYVNEKIMELFFRGLGAEWFSQCLYYNPGQWQRIRGIHVQSSPSNVNRRRQCCETQVSKYFLQLKRMYQFLTHNLYSLIAESFKFLFLFFVFF